VGPLLSSAPVVPAAFAALLAQPAQADAMAVDSEALAAILRAEWSAS
jgi:hypothetical protein